MSDSDSYYYMAVYCLVLLPVTTDCSDQEFAVPNCVEGATFDPWNALPDITTSHNYREGNLPPNSKGSSIYIELFS